jgi:hypothetical protein
VRGRSRIALRNCPCASVRPIGLSAASSRSDRHSDSNGAGQ